MEYKFPTSSRISASSPGLGSTDFAKLCCKWGRMVGSTLVHLEACSPVGAAAGRIFADCCHKSESLSWLDLVPKTRTLRSQCSSTSVQALLCASCHGARACGDDTPIGETRISRLKDKIRAQHWLKPMASSVRKSSFRLLPASAKQPRTIVS